MKAWLAAQAASHEDPWHRDGWTRRDGHLAPPMDWRETRELRRRVSCRRHPKSRARIR